MAARPRVGFSRTELRRLIGLYSRGVAAGEWRDYAIEVRRERAAFLIYRRTMERPSLVVEKAVLAGGVGYTLASPQRIIARAPTLAPILEAMRRRPRLVRT